MLTTRRRALIALVVAIVVGLPVHIGISYASNLEGECADGRAPGCVPENDGNDYTGCVSLSGYHVPCSHPNWGDWSNELHCYLKLVEPQPAHDNPIWEGRTHGAVYWCTVMSTGRIMGIMDDRYQIWLPDGPGPSPNLTTIAEQILTDMNLQPVTIGMAPRPIEHDSGSIGLVGAPVWMWATNPSPHTWGPITDTTTVAGITVTVTAHVEHATWSMGDGNTHTCTEPGTAYRETYGVRDSPTCGHQYVHTSSHEPRQAYTVTVITTWAATWEASTGASGTLDVDTQSSTAHVRIGERQLIEQ